MSESNAANQISGSGPESGTGAKPVHFSFARLAFFSLGGGVVVLLVAIPIIYFVARASQVGGLIVALVALIVMVAVIGVVAKRMVGAVERSMRAAHTESNDS